MSYDRFDTLVAELKKTTFYTDPASTRFHCSYEGGLYEHSKHVMDNLLNLTVSQRLKWEDPESPHIIGMAHDICKIGAYLPDGYGGYYYYKDQPQGHGSLSVRRLLQYIDLTDEEISCIRWHMGAFDKEENWNRYTAALRKYPNVLWTHTADMMATNFDEGGI